MRSELDARLGIKGRLPRKCLLGKLSVIISSAVNLGGFWNGETPTVAESRSHAAMTIRVNSVVFVASETRLLAPQLRLLRAMQQIDAGEQKPWQGLVLKIQNLISRR
jgi:hypothetical protein